MIVRRDLILKATELFADGCTPELAATTVGICPRFFKNYLIYKVLAGL